MEDQSRLKSGPEAELAVNLWVQNILLELLHKTEAKSETISSLQNTVMQILALQSTPEKVTGSNRKTSNSVSEILINEFGIHNVELLLTSLLFDLYNNDILSALPVAYHFGPEICLMVDFLTRNRQRGEQENEHYGFVIDRFNSATSGKEIRLMSIVIIVEMAFFLLTLRFFSFSLKTAKAAQGLEKSRKCVVRFLEVLDVDSFDGKFVHVFTDLKKAVQRQLLNHDVRQSKTEKNLIR